MTATETSEYRELALDSSNDMIRHDARRSDRKYVEAALHIRKAGLGRLRMGQMMFDAGEFAQAAADWLSAAACFYLVPDLERMRGATEQVRKLDQEGKIPPERRDIHEALKEREKQAEELDRRLKSFWLDYRRMVGSQRAAIPEALDMLQAKVRELPGDPHLQVEISDQAKKLGQRLLAMQSLEWARRFDPENTDLAALQVSQLFDLGETVQAAAVARKLLDKHPEMDTARFLLAQALAFRAGPKFADWKVSDWEEAIEELQPLLSRATAEPLPKLLALGLAAIIHHGLGHSAEHRRAVIDFDKLADNNPSLVNAAAQIRRSTPQVFSQAMTNGVSPSLTEKPHSPVNPDHEALRRVFQQFSSYAGAGA